MMFHSTPSINIFLALLELIAPLKILLTKTNQTKAVLYSLKPHIRRNFIASHVYKLFMESE